MTAFHVYMDFETNANPTKSYEVNAITSSTEGDPVPAFNYKDLGVMKLLWCCNLVNLTTFVRSPKDAPQDNMKAPSIQVLSVLISTSS